MIRLIGLLIFYSISLAVANDSLRGSSTGDILEGKSVPTRNPEKQTSVFRFKNTCKDTAGKTHTFGDMGYDQCMTSNQGTHAPSNPSNEVNPGVSISTDSDR